MAISRLGISFGAGDSFSFNPPSGSKCCLIFGVTGGVTSSSACTFGGNAATLIAQVGNSAGQDTSAALYLINESDIPTGGGTIQFSWGNTSTRRAWVVVSYDQQLAADDFFVVAGPGLNNGEGLIEPTAVAVGLLVAGIGRPNRTPNDGVGGDGTTVLAADAGDCGVHAQVVDVATDQSFEFTGANNGTTNAGVRWIGVALVEVAPPPPAAPLPLPLLTVPASGIPLAVPEANLNGPEAVMTGPFTAQAYNSLAVGDTVARLQNDGVPLLDAFAGLDFTFADGTGFYGADGGIFRSGE